MDLLSAIAAVVLTGLPFLLMGVGASSAARYRDHRFALVAAGLGVVGVVGILGLLHQISPLYGGGFDITLVPLLLLVIAVALIYLAMVRRGPQPTSSR
jgi:hypothetical protein